MGFEPTTTMAILAGAGGVMKSVGQYQELRSAAELEAAQEALSRRTAGEAEYAASYQAHQILRRGRQLAGRQRALYGKAGVELSGSPLEVMAESAAAVEADAVMAMRRGQQVRQGALMEAKSHGRRAETLMGVAPFAMGETLLSAGIESYRYKKGLF